MNSFENLWKEHIVRADQLRDDMMAVGGFERQPPSYDRDENLFWNVCLPSAMSMSGVIVTGTELAPLPDELEDAFLNKLADLEERTRVPFQPDEDTFSKFGELLTYVHVAGARALRLKRKAGYSDDVRQCLESAWRAACRLDVTPPGLGFSDAPSGIISLWAVTGLVLAELFRIRRLEARYEEALHYLVASIEYFGAAASSVEQPAEEIDLHPDSRADEEVSRERLKGYLASAFDVDSTEAAETFNSLRSQKKRGVDWKKVARDCEYLAITWGQCVGCEGFEDDITVTDAEGEERTWPEFWHIAQGWAEAQLKPNELRELLSEREDERAVERLTRYFFVGESWKCVPERAQRALVDADRAWFSAEKGRIEVILNELQVATETLCYSFIWEPLLGAKGSQQFLEFMKVDIVLKEKGFFPTLADYSWACKRPFFKEFIAPTDLPNTENDFLTHELPKALDRLRKLRDQGQHDPKRKWQREEVEPIFKEFLGIRNQGILPRLVQVGVKIAPRAIPRVFPQKSTG